MAADYVIAFYLFVMSLFFYLFVLFVTLSFLREAWTLGLHVLKLAAEILYFLLRLITIYNEASKTYRDKKKIHEERKITETRRRYTKNER